MSKSLSILLQFPFFIPISTDAKRLFRENDTAEKNLAGYAKIRWWNNWVQMYQICNNGCDKIHPIATQLLSNDKCEASSKNIIAIWKDPIARARVIVQLAANIDYGIPFCKSCFNLEGDAYGLAFVTGEEIKKLGKMIYDTNSICIKRTITACNIAEDLVNPIVTSQKAIIREYEIELDRIENQIAENIVNVDNLSMRSIAECNLLQVNDKVTLTRRVGRLQVRGKVIGVYVTNKGKVSYDVEPDNGAILQQQSEFSMVKTSTGNRAHQRNEDITNLAKVGEKQDHQKERLSKVIQAMEENEVIKEQMKKAQTSVRDEKKKLVEIGPHKQKVVMI